MRNNLIGVYTCSVSTEMMDFARTGIYRTVPMVFYKINQGPVQHMLINRPVEIFHENMDYRSLRSLVGGDDQDTSFLSIPGKAYAKMQNYINQNVNKVIADMVTCVIVKTIRQLKSEDRDAKNIFFIDNVNSNKMIGRLGYLYLDSEANTIVFVTYKASGLMTDVLNGGAERVAFDYHYFDRRGNRKQHSAIVPNDYMESLTQTVFFNVADGEESLAPLRCDILSQGISKNRTREKVMELGKVFAEQSNLTLPFEDTSGKKQAESWARIPVVLKECMIAADYNKFMAEDILRGDL